MGVGEVKRGRIWKTRARLYWGGMRAYLRRSAIPGGKQWQKPASSRITSSKPRKRGAKSSGAPSGATRPSGWCCSRQQSARGGSSIPIRSGFFRQGGGGGKAGNRDQGSGIRKPGGECTRSAGRDHPWADGERQDGAFAGARRAVQWRDCELRLGGRLPRHGAGHG